MLFNSINFLIFFPVVTAIYFILPHKMRWLLLLLASCYFYMAFVPVFILILAFTITVDYVAGIYIENAEGKRRKQFLIASIIANVGVLFIFKYFNFANQNIAALAQFLDWNYTLQGLSLILPIGLSFHTFQSLSYTIEVYRGRQKAEKNFGIFALYVMFYPQLVAGPIERPQNLLHQFYEKHVLDWSRIGGGLELMLYGFFKKLFIADNLAPFVNQVYDHPESYNSVSFIIATVFFAFQIYCDFSGYSDIAIGAARVMGIRLMQNFRQPYFSQSVGEFWRRWHISLSTWFKDYVYIPLGGSRVDCWRHARNIFITFLLSGIWHGANWTFVVWGILNGLYLGIEVFGKRFTLRMLPNLHVREQHIVTLRLLGLLKTIITFALISLAWVFFRAKNIGEAWHIVSQIFTGWGNAALSMPQPDFYAKYVYMGRSDYDFTWAVTGVIMLLVLEYLTAHHTFIGRLYNEKRYIRYALRWLMISTALLFIIVFSKTESQQFIYFQF